MKISLFTFLILIVCALQAQNYGPYKQFVNVDFETTGIFDDLNNTTLSLQNGASVVFDSERNSKVVQFVASQKGNLKFTNSPLNDTITIAFWYKREALDANEAWRMMFSFYANDGSNVYFTPKTTWNNNAYLVSDFKSFAIYNTLQGAEVVNFKWSHYVIQFVGNSVKVYQDGALTASSVLLTKLSDIKITKWFFGCNPALNYPMTGKLDDIKIYHSALSGNQIKALFENKSLPELVDEVKPFVHLPLDIDVFDRNNNIQTTASNVSFTTDFFAGKVAQLAEDARVSFGSNPFGNDKFSLAFMLKKAVFSADNTKYIFKAKGTNNNFIGLRINNSNNQNKIDLVSFFDNTLTVLATTSTSTLLNANSWNSIVFAQTYDASGTSTIRIFINGISALVKSNVDLHAHGFSNWLLGSDGDDNLAANIDEVKIYQRELSSSEVISYNLSQTTTVTITANLSQQNQTIRNFGSSDGWNTQPVGLYFNTLQKEKLAELLFSTDKDVDGTPKGIGLSAWRFNIGAGTFEQGAASRITTPERRSECFLNADGSYNWNKQAGQRWFLDKAVKTYNVPDIIGWQNSPPVHYTLRGLGFREFGDAKSSILKTDKYDDFGKFLSEVVLHFKQEGINFNYISPLNEPQWDWAATAAGGDVSQEGSPWTNTEISNVTKAINNEFIAKGVEAKLLVGEAGSINHLMSGTGVAQNQLTNLWNSSSLLKISNVPSVANIVSSHSYFTDTSADALITTRKNLNTTMKATYPNFEYWQTEYSLLNNGYKFGFPTDRTLTPMESGVALARVIHADLTQGNATGWQWWTTFEFIKNLSSEDRFALVNVALNTTNTEGIYKPTKLLYTLGNFSHFLRPGTKRLSITRTDNLSDINAVSSLMVSAYVNEAAKELIYVVINPTTNEKAIKLSVQNLLPSETVSEFTPYVTTDNSSDNIKKYPSFNASERFIMPATSVVTFVGKINNSTSVDNVELKNKQFRVYPNPAQSVLYVGVNNKLSNNSVAISDISGKKLIHKLVDNFEDTFSIDISSLTKGVYFIALTNSINISTLKFIVK